MAAAFSVARRQSSSTVMPSSVERKAAEAVSTSGAMMPSISGECGIGPSVSSAQQQAYRLAEQIRWNGCFYRKDIGYRAIARERGEG